MTFDVSERYFEGEPEEPSAPPSAKRGGVTLADVHAAFDRLMFLPDYDTIDVALAGAVANYAEGDPVWPLLVGPPASGKSEVISSLTDAPSVWPLSSLTPQTLLSGFPQTGDKPPSLLLQIGEFGILAFKDLTTVLTMHREARAAIIGQLREIADGRTEKSFGNGIRIEWEGKLGLVAGVTPVIDEQHAFLAIMGERFLLYRLREVDRREVTRRSLEKRGREGALRQEIRAIVSDFLKQFVDCGPLGLPPSFSEPLIHLADLVTRARSGVAREGYSRELLYLPEPEAPTRLAKQLAQLGAGAKATGLSDEDTWQLLRKIGWDSVPAVRYRVIDTLAREPGNVTIAHIQELTDLPQKTAQRVVEDLVVLKLAERTMEGGRWYVQQSDIAASYWDKEISPTPRASQPETSEGSPPLARGVATPPGPLPTNEVERLLSTYYPGEDIPPEHRQHLAAYLLEAERRQADPDT